MHPIFDEIRNESAEEPFIGSMQIDDLSFLDELDKIENAQKLKGIINNEISLLMEKQISKS